jgi:hypothetical protein
MSQSLSIPVAAIAQLDEMDGGDALRLLYRLERVHWDRDQFYLPQSFAVELGWGVHRFRKARDQLVKARLIERVTRGGRFDGDAPLFAWPNIYKKSA